MVLDAAIASGGYQPVGFLDDIRPSGQFVDELPILGTISSLPEIHKQDPTAHFVVAVGDNFMRHRVVQSAEQNVENIRWATIVDPSARVSARAIVGPGSMICAGVLLNPSVEIAKHVILNNGASVAHDNYFGDFSSAGPGVTTGGSVSVGEFSHIGIGATITHNVTIGIHAVVGAGAVVVGDVDDLVIVTGTPARVVRSREVGSRYL